MYGEKKRIHLHFWLSVHICATFKCVLYMNGSNIFMFLEQNNRFEINTLR